MSFQLREAKRENVKLKIGLSGPSGAGKTLSALYLAKGIQKGDMSKVAVLDTENGSALYYADLAEVIGWKHIPFDPPYSPQRFVEGIRYAQSQGIETLIIDSASHEWEGEGGCLDIHTQLSKTAKNSYTVWGDITPLHNQFVDTMRTSLMHIICNVRSKQEYVLEKNDKGKSVPIKVGMKGIQREGLDYEMGIMFDIDMAHFATTSKDRTNLFVDQLPFKITPDTGSILLDWANGGVEAIYKATAKQKIQLANAAKEKGVTEVNALKELSEEALKNSISVSGLNNFVHNYIDNMGAV